MPRKPKPSPLPVLPLLVLLSATLVPKLAGQPDDHARQRERLVSRHIEDKGIRDPAVLRAMRSVPRHRFVPDSLSSRAYEDRPLPIGHGQTISQPYVVAYMTEFLALEPGDKVLEIGSGSGYQAAVLAEITDAVYSIEIVRPLAGSARDALRQAGYSDVRVRHGDGYFGWAEHAPFDAIIITAATASIPPPLIEQLADGGRMILPLGSPYGSQRLVLVTKRGDQIRTRNLIPVRFVPFTRAD